LSTDRKRRHRGAASRVRFVVVPARCIEGGRARLEGAAHHHLARVLRLGPGDPLALSDERGTIHRGRIASVEAASLEVELEEQLPPPLTPRPRVTLIYGLSRRTRSEWVLQKATELGVDAIALASCARSVAHPEADRLPRWEEIVRQAAGQSGRSVLPAILPPAPLALVLEGYAGVRARGRTLICDPSGRPLTALLGPPAIAAERHVVVRPERTERQVIEELAVAVGPEGGFDEEELQAADALGFERAALGPLVLRTETAALAALTLCLALGGRWAAG